MFRAPVFLLHDSGSYYQPAHDLIHGLGFDLSIRRTPGYPLFLAGTIFTLGEDLVGVALVQHALGVVAAALVYLLGQATFGRAAGFGAGVLTGLDGTLLVSEHYVMPETLLTVALLLSLLALTFAIRRRSPLLYLATGVLCGVSILCKPVAQVMMAIVPIALVASYGSLRRALLPTALVGAGLAVVVLPWMLRNLVVHGSFTTAGALGQTLIARTAKHDSGFRYYDPRRAEDYGDRAEVTARQLVQNGINQRLSDGVIYRRVQQRLGLSDPEANAFMRDLAIEVIASEPAYYLQGTARMTWQLLVGEVERLRTDWKTQNARLTRDEWEDRVAHLLARPSIAHENEFERAQQIVGLYQPAVMGPALPILALVGIAVGLAGLGPRHAALPGLVAVAMLVVSAALDGPVTRYRYPADPLIALSAMGSLWLMGTLVFSWVARARWRGGTRMQPVEPLRRAEGT